MADPYQYTALMCSLPSCNQLFNANYTPISRFQLQQRLTMLSPEDAQDMSRLADILDWFRQPHERTDQQLLKLFNHNLQAIQSADISDLLVWRLSFRSVVAALRRRYLGHEFPQETWAHSRWLPTIKRNWHEPMLGLEKRLPWVPEAVRCLREERAMDLEKLLLQQIWLWLERCSWEHQFDLAAVAIYRMRWDLISRWVTYAKEPAQQRFKAMVTELVDPLIETPTTIAVS